MMCLPILDEIDSIGSGMRCERKSGTKGAAAAEAFCPYVATFPCSEKLVVLKNKMYL